MFNVHEAKPTFPSNNKVIYFSIKHDDSFYVNMFQMSETSFFFITS